MREKGTQEGCPHTSRQNRPWPLPPLCTQWSHLKSLIDIICMFLFHTEHQCSLKDWVLFIVENPGTEQVGTVGWLNEQINDHFSPSYISSQYIFATKTSITSCRLIPWKEFYVMSGIFLSNQILHLRQTYTIPFHLNHARPTCIIITHGSHLSDRSGSVASNYISNLKGRVLYL